MNIQVCTSCRCLEHIQTHFAYRDFLNKHIHIYTHTYFLHVNCCQASAPAQTTTRTRTRTRRRTAPTKQRRAAPRKRTSAQAAQLPRRTLRPLQTVQLLRRRTTGGRRSLRATRPSSEAPEGAKVTPCQPEFRAAPCSSGAPAPGAQQTQGVAASPWGPLALCHCPASSRWQRAFAVRNLLETARRWRAGHGSSPKGLVLQDLGCQDSQSRPVLSRARR